MLRALLSGSLVWAGVCLASSPADAPRADAAPEPEKAYLLGRITLQPRCIYQLKKANQVRVRFDLSQALGPLAGEAEKAMKLNEGEKAAPGDRVSFAAAPQRVESRSGEPSLRALIGSARANIYTDGFQQKLSAAVRQAACRKKYPVEAIDRLIPADAQSPPRTYAGDLTATLADRQGIPPALPPDEIDVSLLLVHDVDALDTQDYTAAFLTVACDDRPRPKPR